MWIKRKLTDKNPYESAVEVFESHGIHGLIQANNDRVPGWRKAKSVLYYKLGEATKFEYFDHWNQDFEELIPAQIADDNNPEDLKKKGMEDHIPDEFRYAMFSNVSVGSSDVSDAFTEL